MAGVTQTTLHRQGLVTRAGRRQLVPHLRRLVAVQAQVPTVPWRAMAARVEGVTPSSLDRLSRVRRKLVRTWCLRGTMHVLHVDDLPMMQVAVMQNVADWARAALVRKGYLTAQQLRKNERIILAALDEGPVTATQLRERGAEVHSWGLELRALCAAGVMLPVGRKGGESYFDLTERWLGGPLATPDRDEARRQLALRYLRGYGPASARDLAYWSGWRIRDAKETLDQLEERLVARPGGLLDVPNVRTPSEDPPPRLLPRFDVLVLGHRDRSRFFDEAVRTRIFRPAAVVEAVFLVDGRVAGTWREARGKLKLEPFGKLSRADRAALGDEFVRLRGLGG